MFCSHPGQTLLGTVYFSKSSWSVCAVGFGSRIEMMFFPYVARHTRAVNLRAVAFIHTCTELLCKWWLLPVVVQNLCLLEQQQWVLSPSCHGPWSRWPGWHHSTLCSPHQHLPCGPQALYISAYLGGAAQALVEQPEQVSLHGWIPMEFQYCI